MKSVIGALRWLRALDMGHDIPSYLEIKKVKRGLLERIEALELPLALEKDLSYVQDTQLPVIIRELEPWEPAVEDILTGRPHTGQRAVMCAEKLRVTGTEANSVFQNWWEALRTRRDKANADFRVREIAVSVFWVKREYGANWEICISALVFGLRKLDTDNSPDRVSGSPEGEPMQKEPESAFCPRCGKSNPHNCTKMAGMKSPCGPKLMVDHSAGWPYTDPNVDHDC